MTESEVTPACSIQKPEMLSQESMEQLDKPDLIKKLTELQDYMTDIKLDDITTLRESDEKLRQKLSDVNRREVICLKTLTEKEQEISDLAAQLEELRQYQQPSTGQLRSMLLEPTVNVVINKLTKELETTKTRLEESQSELSAWKFTQDSQTGKQLMARCRTLLKENEELGKQISQGRIAKLEGEIALEKKLVEEMRVAQNETEQFVMELDDDTEGLQATVYLLQQQLKEATDRVTVLESNQIMPNSEELPSNSPRSENHSDNISQAANTGAELTQHEASKMTEEEMETERTDHCQQQDEPSSNGSPTNGHLLSNELTTDGEALTEDVCSRAMTPTADENEADHSENNNPALADQELTEQLGSGAGDGNLPVTDSLDTQTDEQQVESAETIVSEKMTTQCDTLTPPPQQQVHNGHTEMLVN